MKSKIQSLGFSCYFFILVSCVWLGIMPNAAHAQADEIEEIIVTATKRGETLLRDTPITLNVIGGDSLKDRNIRNSEDLAAKVVGLTVDQGLGTPRMTIRGISNDVNLGGADNGVAVYMDGVPIGRPTALLASYNDLERVEVLKGPQGSAFGRNATGGAVNYILQGPEEGFHAEIGAEFGSFDRRGFRAMANYGAENYGIRVSGFQSEDDGYVTNLYDNSDVNGKESKGIRVIAEAKPSEKVYLRYLFDTVEDDTSAGIFAIKDGLTVGTLATGIDVAAGVGLGTAFGFPEPISVLADDSYEIVQDLSPVNDNEVTTHALTAEFDLGFATLKSITGHMESDNFFVADADSSSVPFAHGTVSSQEAKAFSQEINLRGVSGPLDWVVGAFYYDEKMDEINGFELAPTLLPTGFVLDRTWDWDIESISGFADGSWTINDIFSVFGGVRYTEDTKKQEAFQTFTLGPLAAAPGFVLTICSDSFERDFDKVTWQAGVKANISENTMAFFRQSRGYKAGGINTGGCPDDFDPETLDSYEVGIKTRLFDNRLDLGISAFYYDYADKQLTVVRPNPLVMGSVLASIENAPKAEVLGAELQVNAILGGGFSLDSGISYMPVAEYKEFESVDPFQPALGLHDLNGNRLSRAPKLTANIGFEYETSVIEDVLSLNARLEAYHVSETDYVPFNRPVSTEESHTFLNAYLTLRHRENITVRGYVKNLTDEFYLNGYLENNGFSIITAQFGRPRESGIEVTWRY